MILPPDINITTHFHPEDLKTLENIETSEKILFETTTYFNEIAITENQFGRFLKFGDSYQAGILKHGLYQGNLHYTNYFLLAPLFNQNIKNILILGMGTGNLAHNFLKLIPDLKNIDIVEIDPEVVDVAQKYFDFKPDKKINVHIQDARVFVRNIKNKYDLIILDIFTSSGLPYRFMTEEFLRETNTILNKNGIIFTNMFGLQNIDSDNNLIFKSLLKTYKSVFNQVLVQPALYGNIELYRTLFGLKHDLTELTNILIIASNSKTLLSKRKIIDKAQKMQDKFNIIGIKKIDKYAGDIFEIEINVNQYKNFLDNEEEELKLNLNNLKEYLKCSNPK